MQETLTALYRRNEVFWLGLFAVLVGVLLPQPLELGPLDVPSLFVVTGGGLLFTSFFVGGYRLVSST